MKKLHFFCLSLLFISSWVFAQQSMTMNTNTNANANENMNMKWVCKTNASMATNAADKSADDSMKTPNNLKAAFDFASGHCRNCTKITCTMQK